jgi:hypothetical protein
MKIFPKSKKKKFFSLTEKDVTSLVFWGIIVVIVIAYYFVFSTSPILGPQIVPPLVSGGVLYNDNDIYSENLNLYPGVNVAYNTEQVVDGVFIVKQTPTFPIPSNFTFLSNWSFDRFNEIDTVKTTTYVTNDTISALPNEFTYSYGAAFGNVAITQGQRIIFSVLQLRSSGNDVSSGRPNSVGIGLENSSTQFLGDGSFAFLNDGTINNNEEIFNTSFSPFFSSNNQIIDVAVDTIDQKIWYRVDGASWQG